MNNYQIELSIPTTKQHLFEALTIKIPEWWSTDFTGASSAVNQVFSVHFGNAAFKTIQVNKLVKDEFVSWTVIDSEINTGDLLYNKEWTNTRIEWSITDLGNSVLLNLLHIGLTPDKACYSICENGWLNFVESLRKYLLTGSGTPYID